MTTYIVYFLMFIPPAPAKPLFTAEKFTDPVACEMRVEKLRVSAPEHKFTCQRITTPIDLSKPASGVTK